MATISVLALSPKSPPDLSLGWDKLNHGVAFAALALAGCFAHPRGARTRIAVTGALLLYGGLIEAVQSLVPGRSAQWSDLLADAIGIAAGTGVGAYVMRWSRSRV